MKHGDEETFYEIVEQNAVELVVIGPEAPLVDGMADELAKRGIAAFGPSAKAARQSGRRARIGRRPRSFLLPS